MFAIDTTVFFPAFEFVSRTVNYLTISFNEYLYHCFIVVIVFNMYLA